VPGWCRHHGTGNVLEPAIRILGILNPSFCGAKKLRNDTFHSKFWRSVRLELEDHLVHVRQSQDTTWQPAEADVRHARMIMELAYHKRDLFADVEDADLDAKVEAMRKKADRFVRNFPGNWRERTVLFFDSPLLCDQRLECESREAAIDFVIKEIEDVAFHVLGEPSSNKWLSVWRAIRHSIIHRIHHHIHLR
jgi:hypothetical protein